MLRALWMVVRTGRFAARHSFVPLTDAESDGDVIVTPYGKHEIEDAPRVDTTHDLDEIEVRGLYSYYGLAYDEPFDPDSDDVPRLTAADRVVMYLA